MVAAGVLGKPAHPVVGHPEREDLLNIPRGWLLGAGPQQDQPDCGGKHPAADPARRRDRARMCN